MKKIYTTVVLALVALLSITMSASANTNTVTMNKGVSAFASWATPATGFTDLDVFQATPDGAPDMTTTVDVFECQLSFFPFNCGFYLGTVDNSAFKMIGKGALKEATLDSVTLPLVFSFGVAPATITVDADWTGVGDITTTSFTSKFHSDTLIARFAADTRVRSATATGDDSINGALGTSSFADLFSFRTMDHTVTKP